MVHRVWEGWTYLIPIIVGVLATVLVFGALIYHEVQIGKRRRPDPRRLYIEDLRRDW